MLSNKSHISNSSTKSHIQRHRQNISVPIKYNSDQHDLHNLHNLPKSYSDKNAGTFLKKSDVLFKKENDEFKRISEMVNSIKDAGQSPFKLTKEDKVYNNEIDAKHGELPIIGDGAGLLVNYDKQLTKFTFYKQNDQLIGSFTIPQLIRYLGHYWDTYDQFMAQTNYTQAIDIIESLVGSAKYNETEKIVAVILNDYKKSPFMGNIEMLINLNNGLHDFEKNSLTGELDKVDKKIQPKIIITIKQFIYLLVHHTLKIITIASENIKNSTQNTIKESLMRYSLGLVFRISQFIKEQLEDQIGKYDQITNQMVTIHNSRDVVGQKMDVMNKLIKDQNTKIETILNKLEEQHKNKMIEQLGGKNGYTSNDSKLDKISSSSLSDDNNNQESSTASSSSSSSSSPESGEKQNLSNTSITEDQDDVNITNIIGADEENEKNKEDNNNPKSEYSAIYEI